MIKLNHDDTTGTTYGGLVWPYGIRKMTRGAGWARLMIGVKLNHDGPPSPRLRRASTTGTTYGIRDLKDAAHHAVRESCGIEVEQNPKTGMGQFQVRDKLGFMDGE